MTACTTISTNENAEVVVVVSDSVGPGSVVTDVTRLEKLYRDAVITFKKDKTNKDKRRARTKAKRLWDEATLQFCRLQEEEEEEGGGDNNKSKATSAIQLRCKDCSQQFIWTSREQEYYKDPERNWIHQPQRCRLCAELQKGRRRYNNTNDTEDNDEGKEEEEDDDKKMKKKKEGKHMCYQFQRDGECRYGNECKFNHDPNFAGKPKEKTTTKQDDGDGENKNENEKKRQHNNENENENSSSSSPTSSTSSKKKMKTEHNHDEKEKEKDKEGTIISQQTCKWGKDCRLKRCRFKHNDDGDNDDTCTVITTAKTQPITGTDIDNRTDTTTVSSTNSTRKIAIDVIPTGEEVSRQEEEKQEKKKKKKKKKTKKKARHWVEEKK